MDIVQNIETNYFEAKLDLSGRHCIEISCRFAFQFFHFQENV